MLIVAMKPSHKLFLQLSWDIGENVMTIMKLQKMDCKRMINAETYEPEYLINLPQHKIKRSRTSRTEITNYRETTELIDLHFQQGKRIFCQHPEGKEFQRIRDEKGVRKKVTGNWRIVPFKENDYLFDFGQKQAEKIFRRCVNLTGIKCQPNGERPTIKDLRSSMACHLLKQGWSIDEVKGRMGHKPSSHAIDRYATYLALDKHKAKRKMFESDLIKYQEELKKLRSRERRHEIWIENQKKEVGELKALMQVYIAKLKQLEEMQAVTSSIPR
jgi:integrase-like protein